MKAGDLVYGDWKEEFPNGDLMCSVGLVVCIEYPETHPKLINVLWPDNTIEQLYADDVELI